ncbi:MAG TPA: hypothetical protein VLH84_05000 [Patescibacteria group bacterium]|nr:hypothetical protein [Patescibacteria group bacterium]
MFSRRARQDIRHVRSVAQEEQPHLFALADAVLKNGIDYDCIVTDMIRGYFPGRVIGDVATAAALQRGSQEPTRVSIANSGRLFFNYDHRAAIKTYLARVGASNWGRTLLVVEHIDSGATASLLATELEEAGTKVDFAVLSADSGGRYSEVLPADHPNSALYIGRTGVGDPPILSDTLRAATGFTVFPGLAVPEVVAGSWSNPVVVAAHQAFDQIAGDYATARGLNR